MDYAEKISQAILAVNKASLRARKVKGPGTPSLPPSVLSGAKLNKELVSSFLKCCGYKGGLAGEALVMAGYYLEKEEAFGFLFTSQAVYVTEGLLYRNGENKPIRKPLCYCDVKAVRQDRKLSMANSYCILKFRDGSEEVVYGSIYATYFTEVMSRILPLVPKEVPQERKKTPLIPNEKKQNSAAEEWVCPNCGNRASGNFCANCGRPRQERKSEPKPEPKPEPTPKSDAKPKAKETFKTDIEWKQELDALPNLVFANPKMLSISQIWSQDRKTLLFQASPGAEDREVPPNVRDKKSYTNAECCWYAQKLARAGECDMAAELLKYAMRKGSDDAYFMLGMLYLDHQLSTDHREDLPRAHGLIVQAAHKGNEMAKGMIRDLYFTEADFPGSVPEKWRQPHRRGKTDYTEAIKLLAAGKKYDAYVPLKSAAEEEYAPAMYLLARMALVDDLAVINPMEASAYLHRCAARCYGDAAQVLKKLFPPVPEPVELKSEKQTKPAPVYDAVYAYAMTLYENGGCAQAEGMLKQLEDVHPQSAYQRYLWMRENGAEGSIAVLRKAVALGHKEAIQKYGNILCAHLLSDNGGALKMRDVAYIEQRLKEMNTPDYHYVAACYAIEKAKPEPCYADVIYHYRMYVQAKNPDYYANLAYYCQQANPDDFDDEKRLYWLTKGANFGSALCMYNIADFYAKSGKNHNDDLACTWAIKCFERTKEDKYKCKSAKILAQFSREMRDRQRWTATYRQYYKP